MKKSYAYICFSLFILTVAALVGDALTSDNQARPDGPVVALASPQRLPVVTDNDTAFVALAKGDSVRIIGFRRLTSRQSVLVMTPKGDLGFLDASQLPVPQIVTEGGAKGDTIVTLKPVYSGRSVNGYMATLASGEEREIQANMMAPALKGWSEYNLENYASTSVATRKALEQCKGYSLEEIERRYGMANDILVSPDGSKTASFRIYAYGRDGRPYLPAVTFDSNGKATKFDFTLLKGKPDNGWLLGNLPLAGKIIDMPLIRTLTRSDVYSLPGHTGEATPFYIYILYILKGIGLLAWYLLTPALLVLLMGCMLYVPLLFRPFNNGPMRILFIAAAVIGTYIWSVALMAWGMHWSALIPVFAAVWVCTRTAMRIIDFRCTGCGHLDTIRFDHEEVTGTEYTTQPYQEFRRIVGKSTDWDSYNEKITTYWSDGSTTERTVQHTVRLLHTFSEYDDYDVTFRVTHKLLHYVCSVCGHTETFRDDLWEEVSRRKTGSHTTRKTEVDSIY